MRKFIILFNSLDWNTLPDTPENAAFKKAVTILYLFAAQFVPEEKVGEAASTSDVHMLEEIFTYFEESIVLLVNPQLWEAQVCAIASAAFEKTVHQKYCALQEECADAFIGVSPSSGTDERAWLSKIYEYIAEEVQKRFNIQSEQQVSA